jgi:purine-cytosine permease-like protein
MIGETMIGAIIALVLGIALIVLTAHILLDILGAIIAIAGAIWLIRYLIGNRSSRTDL